MPETEAGYIGIDVGTSGARAILIDGTGSVLATARAALPGTRHHDGMQTQHPDDWWQGVLNCLEQLADQHPLDDVAGLCVDGTSGTVLLSDNDNTPLTPALMYSDTCTRDTMQRFTDRFPGMPGVSGPGSALLKAWWLHRQYQPDTPFYIQQQADWVLARLRGQPGFSDWNNAMKLGFDVERLAWPRRIRDMHWLDGALPEAAQPGCDLGMISPDMTDITGLPDTVRLHAGTTDGVAAFLASGASQPGEAVTSLGTTMILKLCSHSPVSSQQHGVYSHRLDQQRWLSGGASNTGGAVLQQYFTAKQLSVLSAHMPTDTDSGLDYYPLPATGERFPVNDPDLKPKLSPVPDDPVFFLQGMFEGMARIEKSGYDLLEHLGAEPVRSIRTVGGGAINPAWRTIRERIVGRRIVPALHEEAAYGVARLAAGLV